MYIYEGINKPYKDLSGAIWTKQGSDKRRVTENSEILRLFSESGNYAPDEAFIENTTPDDIDRYKLNEYLDKIYGKSCDEFDIPYIKLLKNLRFANDNGQLSLAALLFFGKKPQKFRPEFCIKAVSFYGNEIGGTEYRDSKDIEGTIPEMFEAAIRFLDINLHHIQAGQNFNSQGVLKSLK